MGKNIMPGGMVPGDYSKAPPDHPTPTRKRSAEREQFLGDVIIGAIEGGTGYWAQVSQYQWEDRPCVGRFIEGVSTRATIHQLNDDESGYEQEGLDVDIDVIARGIARIIDGDVKVREDLRRTIAHANIDNDACDIDAEGADVIVQAALFDEVVYG